MNGIIKDEHNFNYKVLNNQDTIVEIKEKAIKQASHHVDLLNLNQRHNRNRNQINSDVSKFYLNSERLYSNKILIDKF